METSSEDLNDQELADLMADPQMEDVGEDLQEDVGGVVECGIPPEISDETVIDSSEQTFSVNDFDESDSPGISESQSVPQQSSDQVSSQAPVEPSSPATSNGSAASGDDEGGDVAQFRKSLANLSRQLELDRLALLHNSLSGNGGKLPTLGQIADDISGVKPLSSDGDLDQFGKRPSARLDGWLSGLSFGTTKRAKKFPK